MRTAGGFLLVGVLIAASPFAAGQVRQIVGGNALDANSQVGSGGVNYAVPNNYYAPGSSATQISSMTQARGLSAFSGHAPTIDDQLGLTVRTDGVSRFDQQSVSFSDVARGGAPLYAPQYSLYKDPLTTTLTLPHIVASQAEGYRPFPGHNPPPETSELAKSLLENAMVDYRLLQPQDQQEAMRGNALGVLPERQEAPATESLMRTIDTQLVVDRGGQELFGMPRQEDRAKLAEEINQFDQKNEAGSPLDLAIRPELQTEAVQPIGAAEQPGLAERLESPQAAQERQKEKERNAQEISTAAGGLSIDLRAAPSSALPQENADPFFDLLLRMRQQQLAEDQTGGKPTEPPNEQLMDRIHQAQAIPTERQSVVLTAGNQILIRRLAGESDDLFNRYMKRGETALRAGRYYEAVRFYRLAVMARPSNPLARLGGCLGNFAAGEWYTAGLDLQAAMECFPPLMESRPELTRLLPIQDWDQRLTALENWLDKVSKRPVLVFLASYMQYNYGHMNLAKKHAEELLQMEKIPPILKAYAEYVSTGKPPAKVRKQTGPTKKAPTKQP